MLNWLWRQLGWKRVLLVGLNSEYRDDGTCLKCCWAKKINNHFIVLRKESDLELLTDGEVRGSRQFSRWEAVD